MSSINVKVIKSKNSVSGVKKKDKYVNYIIDSVINDFGYDNESIKYSTFFLTLKDNVFNTNFEYQTLFIVFEVKNPCRIMLDLNDDINNMCIKLLDEFKASGFVLFENNFYIIYK